eukprot:1108168-Pyramimonas_sp.AAC.2
MHAFYWDETGSIGFDVRRGFQLTQAMQPKPRNAHSFSSARCQRSTLNRKACSLKSKGICARVRIICNAAPEGDAAGTYLHLRNPLMFTCDGLWEVANSMTYCLRVCAAIEKRVPLEFLTGDDLESWKATTAIVEEETGLRPAVAEQIVTRAFGWSSQLYWRKSKIQEVPQPEQVTNNGGLVRAKS